MGSLRFRATSARPTGERIVNCKQGDLAIRVHAPPGCYFAIGSVVRCRQLSPAERSWIGHSGKRSKATVHWLVEHNGETRDKSDGCRFAIPDADLRPIRDPGVDAV